MAQLRHLSPHALVLDPALVGRPLAPPWRRGAALLLDVALLLLPTVGVVLAAAALSLWLTEPVAWRALTTLVFSDPPAESIPALTVDLAPLLIAVDAPGLSSELRYAIERGDRRRIETLMAAAEFTIVVRLDGRTEKAPGRVVVPIERLIPPGVRTLAMFGVPALYFTLAHRGRRGATLGKRLLGIAVRRLDGRRLRLLESLERFGGYFGIPGTIGIGLVELWRDPLRQLGHDRGAGTVVILSRKGR
jgi:hypothetical protein